MRTVRMTMALLAALCLTQSARAQFDEDYEVEEWTLDTEEEEAAGPWHKEYKNALLLQYSPSRYKVGDGSRIHFNELLLGYSRAFQVTQEKPYFVEAGACVKFSWETREIKARVLTFRIPVNVIYKIYPWREKDYAIAPFAGASVRAIALAREHSGEKSTSLLGSGGWNSFQVSWQAGLRFYLNRYFLGFSYTRDFHDTSKLPGIRECGVHLGYSF